MAEHKILPQDDADVLIAGYKFLRKLENRLRLLHDQSINELSAHNKGFRKAALSLGYGASGLHPEQEFLTEYQQVTSEIRNLFEKYLNSTGDGS